VPHGLGPCGRLPRRALADRDGADQLAAALWQALAPGAWLGRCVGSAAARQPGPHGAGRTGSGRCSRGSSAWSGRRESPPAASRRSALVTNTIPAWPPPPRATSALGPTWTAWPRGSPVGSLSARWARYRWRPPLRASTRDPSTTPVPAQAITRQESPAATPRLISSRSAADNEPAGRRRGGCLTPPLCNTKARTEGPGLPIRRAISRSDSPRRHRAQSSSCSWTDSPRTAPITSSADIPVSAEAIQPPIENAVATGTANRQLFRTQRLTAVSRSTRDSFSGLRT
jgi:hypothetical protein